MRVWNVNKCFALEHNGSNFICKLIDNRFEAKSELAGIPDLHLDRDNTPICPKGVLVGSRKKRKRLL